MTPLPDSIEPPVPRDDDGNVRLVGVEIELTDLDVAAIADTIAEVFDGSVRIHNDYRASVDTALGEFGVEADMAFLRRIGERRVDDADGLLAAARDAVASVAETVAPFEVIGPPAPYTALPRMDDLVAALRERGARGTKAGLLSALALQLNPQVPRLTAPCIHDHLRAYVTLAPWLRLRRGVDLSRRATWYVDRFPEAYVRTLLERPEPGSLDELCDDYLAHNPTRNRSLDLLPLLMHLRPDRVSAAVDDPRIKSRPTFHYRLPDSRVGDPAWRVTDEWRHWLVVERVAAQGPLLADLTGAYLELMNAGGWVSVDKAWAEQCEAMLAETGYGTR